MYLNIQSIDYQTQMLEKLRSIRAAFAAEGGDIGLIKVFSCT
jgi:hypothetical protein